MVMIFGGLLAVCALAQKTEHLIDKVELDFELFGDPETADVGFGDPESYWKLEYELMLTDFSELQKLGRCRQLENLHLYCPLSNDKKTVKKIRKISLPVATGQFDKKGQLPEDARRVRIPLPLTAQIIEIYNRAETGENNPTFVLYVRTKAKTKNAAGAKFKKKTWTSEFRPLKFYNQDKTFGFWNVTNIGISFGIFQKDDGRLYGFSFFRH